MPANPLSPRHRRQAGLALLATVALSGTLTAAQGGRPQSAARRRAVPAAVEHTPGPAPPALRQPRSPS
jgi:hypothetical protein